MKIVRHAGDSYERHKQKEKSYPCFCRGDVIWLELHGKLITGPRLVPNELPEALSSDSPTMSGVKAGVSCFLRYGPNTMLTDKKKIKLGNSNKRGCSI